MQVQFLKPKATSFHMSSLLQEFLWTLFVFAEFSKAKSSMSPKMFQNITVYLNHFYFIHYKYLLWLLLLMVPAAAIYVA